MKDDAESIRNTMSEGTAGQGAPRIHCSQMGYLCGTRKRLVVSAEAANGTGEFHIQDLYSIDDQTLGKYENWTTVHSGKLVPHKGPMGEWLIGDFSSLSRPGHYRAVLPGGNEWSFPFLISDGALSRLPFLFLDYVHCQRCGPFENELRGPCHLDDGVRSDTGAVVDTVGGWHDAGDLRKFMATSALPILGLFEVRSRLGLARDNYRERPYADDFLAEAAWGLRWVLKMQDPATGMFYEDVGGGGESRREPGMLWWYENQAGCYADNADNRFTDNRPESGDERRVRVQYHPVVQYIAMTMLLDAAVQLRAGDPAFAGLCRAAALRCWQFMEPRRKDDFHGWTSVLSWRLSAALKLRAAGAAAEAEIAALVSGLLELQSPAGFWFMDSGRSEPYRGIVSSAQPLIALAAFMETAPAHPLVAQAREALKRCFEGFVRPMLATNPFGIMPYGAYSAPRTKGDVYHPFGDGLLFRFFLPENAPEKITIGLSSHWTSWAHGLASIGRVLEDSECREAAFDQLAWLAGCNPLNVSMISGIGYRNAVPYSRFFGHLLGGFSVGPRGTAEDTISVDQEGRYVWSSGEYWLAPLANALLALAELLPGRDHVNRPLGLLDGGSM